MLLRKRDAFCVLFIKKQHLSIRQSSNLSCCQHQKYRQKHIAGCFIVHGPFFRSRCISGIADFPRSAFYSSPFSHSQHEKLLSEQYKYNHHQQQNQPVDRNLISVRFLRRQERCFGHDKEITEYCCRRNPENTPCFPE